MKPGSSPFFGNQWKKEANLPAASYVGTVALRSLGTPSDTWIGILDQLYETKLHPASMRHDTLFTAISLAGEPANLEKEPVKLKLF